jgi:hypothetical protein
VKPTLKGSPDLPFSFFVYHCVPGKIYRTFFKLQGFDQMPGQLITLILFIAVVVLVAGVVIF